MSADSTPVPGPDLAAGDAFAAEMERGRALLEQARTDSRRWSQAFVSSLLDSVKEGAATLDRSARQRRAALVAGEFGQAAAAFRAALALQASRDAYVGVAEALEAQSGTYAAMGPGVEGSALASLAGAVAALDGALGLGPPTGSSLLQNAAGLLDMKARLLRVAGGVQARLQEWDEAAACYREGVEALDELLRIAPEDPDARLSRAMLLAACAGLGVGPVSPAYSPRLPGDPEAALGGHAEALVAFDAALAALDEIASPDRGRAALWKAIELRSLGDLQRSLSRRRAALQSYREAVRLLDEVVAEAPGQRSERGRTLQRTGDLARELERAAEATWAYERGIADLVDPNLPGGYDDLARGTMSIHLGELYLDASRLEEARAYLQEGLEVLLAATGIGEDDKLVRDRLINRGRELLRG
jgi:tetratricopeptide (TPR) repeat protein